MLAETTAVSDKMVNLHQLQVATVSPNFGYLTMQTRRVEKVQNKLGKLGALTAAVELLQSSNTKVVYHALCFFDEMLAGGNKFIQVCHTFELAVHYTADVDDEILFGQSRHSFF